MGENMRRFLQAINPKMIMFGKDEEITARSYQFELNVSILLSFQHPFFSLGGSFPSESSTVGNVKARMSCYLK